MAEMAEIMAEMAAASEPRIIKTESITGFRGSPGNSLGMRNIPLSGQQVFPLTR